METIPKFTKDIAYISKLGDSPNTDNNLTSDELKAKFDKAGEDIKSWLNEQVPVQNANNEELHNAVSRIEADFGQYSAVNNIPLSVGTSGAFITQAGVKVTDSNYAISKAVTVTRGNLYRFKPATSLEGTSVSVFTAISADDQRVPITYTDTFDSNGRYSTRSASYGGHTYLYTYSYSVSDEDEITTTTIKCSIDSGTAVTVDDVPMFYTTSAQQFIPLFGGSGEMAPEGYVYFARNNAQIYVCGLTADITDGTLYEYRYGVMSSVASTLDSANVSTPAIAYAKQLVTDPTLDDPGGYIGMHVEGGGIIFFDYAIGFSGDVSVAPITSGLNAYHVDPATGIVVKDTTSGANRFYVVQDRDLVSTKHSDHLMWSNGTSGTLYTSLGTATGFGTGLANTKLAYAAATTDGLLAWTSNANNVIWHYLWAGDYNARSPKWFVPSKDELYVLLNMQWQTASKRLSYDKKTQLKQLPINLPPYLWSSSESSATVAYIAGMCSGDMATDGKNDSNSCRVRLVRTF